MLTMNDFVDLRMQQQIAHEIYRQQIMQRIPDPFPSIMGLPLPLPHAVIMPPRPTLTGVEAKLENNDLWRQFHSIGTEMIITKSGRRMFPSMRVSFTGMDEDTNYCVLLEMVPIGDCRYKFSGSQWVPAGGAEPQSPQRMFLHPDSPATGAHWQSQAILFNKVKLTNNTLDSNGHIVLASMHKYQPRLHIIRTSELAQLPWAPQQAFVFPETEFVAVTAYQNDRITKLKIDNNPFAKGFRETGQSRCKRKLAALGEEATGGEDSPGAEDRSAAKSPSRPTISNNGANSVGSSTTSSTTSSSSNNNNSSAAQLLDDDRSSVGSFDLGQHKRLRSSSSFDDDACFSSTSSNGTISPRCDEGLPAHYHHTFAHHQLHAHHAHVHAPHHHHHQHHNHHHGGAVHHSLIAASSLYHHHAHAHHGHHHAPHPHYPLHHHHQQQQQQQQQQQHYFVPPPPAGQPLHLPAPGLALYEMPAISPSPAPGSPSSSASPGSPVPRGASAPPSPSTATEAAIVSVATTATATAAAPAIASASPPTQTKRNSFSISSILAY